MGRHERPARRGATPRPRRPSRPARPQDWGSSYVGADFNKPITYHLTLPAGSYNIVGVQAPRAGLTTNVYSKVKVAGTETTKTAVSTGSATPVAQTLTLDADAVVDLEFGTNGTSGYNARLALVYVQSLPRDLGVQGALGVDDDLPETVDVAGTRAGRGVGCRIRRAAARRVRASSP